LKLTYKVYIKVDVQKTVSCVKSSDMKQNDWWCCIKLSTIIHISKMNCILLLIPMITLNFILDC